MVGRVLVAAAVAVVLGSWAPAWAQPGMTPPGAAPYQPPPPVAPPSPALASGLLLDGSAGFGLREDAGFGGSLSLGFRRSAQLAWLFNVTALLGDCTYDCTDEISSLAVLGGGLQWWLTPELWLRGVGGFAFMDSEQYISDEAGLGWAATGAWEIVSGRGAALDVRLTFLGGLFEQVGPVRATLGVGLTIR